MHLVHPLVALVALACSFPSSAAVDTAPAAPVDALGRIGFRELKVGNPITSMAFVDGKLVGGSADSSLLVWDAQSFARVGSIAAIGHGIRTLTPSADGKSFFTASGDGFAARGTLGDSALTQVAAIGPRGEFSPDGKYIATISEDSALVRLLDAAGKEIRTIRPQAMRVSGLAFSPDSKWLALSAWKSEGRSERNGVLRVVPVDAPDDTAGPAIEQQSMYLSALEFMPDGRRLVCGGSDGSVRVFDVETHVFDPITPVLDGAVRTLAIAADGSTIATSASDGVVAVLDDTGQFLIKWKAAQVPVSSLALSPDGKRLASAANDSQVHFWDPLTGERLDPIIGHETSISSVSCSHDGARLAAAAYDGMLCIWDAKTHALVRRVRANLGMAYVAKFAPDSKLLAVAGQDGSFATYDPDGNEVHRLLTGSMAVMNLDWSPDSQNVVLACADSRLRIIKAEDRSTVLEIELPRNDAPFSVAWSPDGKTIAAGSSVMRTYSAADGKLLRESKEPKAPVASIAFTPDSSRLVTGSADRATLLWKVDTLEIERRFEVFPGRVGSVAVSADGASIAACDESAGDVRLYSLDADAPKTVYRGHEGSAHAVCFAPDGTLLSGGDDCAVMIWPLK